MVGEGVGKNMCCGAKDFKGIAFFTYSEGQKIFAGTHWEEYQRNHFPDQKN